MDNCKQEGPFATMSRRVIAVTLGTTTALTLSASLFIANRSRSSDCDISNAIGAPASTIESASSVTLPIIAQQTAAGRDSGFTRAEGKSPRKPYAALSDGELAARVTGLREETTRAKLSFDALVAERRRALQGGDNREAERLQLELMTLARSREQLSARLTESAFELTCRRLVGCNDDTRDKFYKQEK